MREIENKIMDLGVNPNIKENPVFEDILSKVKKLGDLVEYSLDNKNVFARFSPKKMQLNATFFIKIAKHIVLTFTFFNNNLA